MADRQIIDPLDAAAPAEQLQRQLSGRLHSATRRIRRIVARAIGRR
jgi:hypothetical protein